MAHILARAGIASLHELASSNFHSSYTKKGQSSTPESGLHQTVDGLVAMTVAVTRGRIFDMDYTAEKKMCIYRRIIKKNTMIITLQLRCLVCMADKLAYSSMRLRPVLFA